MRIVGETIDVPMPHVMEEIVEGVKHIPQGRVQQCHTAEEIVDAPVPRMKEESIEAVKHILQERVQSNTVEQSVARPVPQIREEIGQVTQLVPQGRISDRNVEKLVDAIQVFQGKVEARHAEKSEQDASDWLDKNPLAERVVSEARQQTLQVVCGHTSKLSFHICPNVPLHT